MSNTAKNLLTYEVPIPAGAGAVELAADSHRSHLRLVSLIGDVRMWIGPDAPPADRSRWFPVPVDGTTFEYGVYGPIYLSESSGAEGLALAVSMVNESQSGATSLFNVCTQTPLVANQQELTVGGVTLAVCT